MALFPSDDWLETYRRRINESAEYRDAAATWEGDVAFLLEAEPDRHVPEGSVGVARPVARRVPRGPDGLGRGGSRRGLFVAAPYSRWRDVMAGELDPIKG
jgi:hypothetical protein